MQTPPPSGAPSVTSRAAAAGDEAQMAIVEALHDLTGLSHDLVENLLWSVAIVIALWGLRAFVLRLLAKRTEDVRTQYQWRKSTQYVAVVLGLLLLVRVWVGAVDSLATFLGLVAAGLAIALKDPLVNLAGWAFVLIRRPLSPGDRITIRGLTGDVIDQRVFQFTLLEVGTSTGAGQSTGRIIHVPNGWVFSDAVVNHTRAFAYVWNEIGVVVTFESDWRAAKTLLLGLASEHVGSLSEDAERTLRRAAQSYLIFYSKLTPTVYTDVLDHGVRLTLRYLCEPRRVRGSTQTVWEALLDALAERDDIDLAYPTTRVIGSGLPPGEGA